MSKENQSNVMINPEFEAECKWLAFVLGHLEDYNTLITRQKKETEENIEESLKMYDPDNKDQYAEVLYKTALLSSLSAKTKVAAGSLAKPFFSRVDFTAVTENKISRYYLGKMTIFGEDGISPLVIDWRAPVAGLYYDGRIGSAAYICPDGEIKGEISLKRQYFIDNGTLTNFFDIDITTNDEFLQSALGSSKDKRLKDIVSTIQAEQNQIIRADMHGPVVVQGAAGSGKTTIALHRIAYLLYNYSKRLSAENVMIIAPNRYFLSYISEVLPDLGVENVRQTTFEDFAFDFIETKLKLYHADEKLAFILKNPRYYDTFTGISKIKSSLLYKKIIETYTAWIIDRILPEKDYMLGDYTLISYKYIKRLFCEDYSFLPVSKRINEIKKYLNSTLKKRKPEIMDDLNAFYDAEAEKIKKTAPEGSPERREAITKLFDERDMRLLQVKKKSAGLASSYFKGIKLNSAFDYYKSFLENEKIFTDCCRGHLKPGDVHAVRRSSLHILSENRVEIEDLAPIMLIHYIFYGTENLSFDIRHIVIDEAQDVSLFQLYILKRLMNTGSFTILGDLCQGIYSFKGITDWIDVSKYIFSGKTRYMTLEQSYRTTVEIMEFANIAARKLNLPGIREAKPVIRHGNAVNVHITDTYEETAAAIDITISEYIISGCKSISVICKTSDECQVISRLLKTTGISTLTGKEKDYGGGIVVLPAHLSKGLEFDGVIIANANPAYTLSETDIKLLYVAMTRALHEMTVFAIGELSPVLL